jgi:hypothetical protein
LEILDSSTDDIWSRSIKNLSDLLISMIVP